MVMLYKCWPCENGNHDACFGIQTVPRGTFGGSRCTCNCELEKQIEENDMMDKKDVLNKAMGIKDMFDKENETEEDFDKEVEKEAKELKPLPKGTCPKCGNNNNPKRAWCRKCSSAL